MLALNGLSVTTISQALRSAGAESAPGSQFSSRAARRPPASICPAFRPPEPGKALTTCAPTVLAASVRKPTVAPVCSPIHWHSASSVEAPEWCAAALPSKMALRSPASNALASALALSVDWPSKGVATPFSAATAAATSASAWAHSSGSATTVARSGIAQAPSFANNASEVIAVTAQPARADCRIRCANSG